MRRLALLFLFLSACAERDLSAVDPRRSAESWLEVPVSVNRTLDILFVVDDSPSMRQEQASLAANFHRFIEVLESLEGGLPDLHLGVVSSNVGTGPDGGGGEACAGQGDDGRLQLLPTCTPLTDGTRYISDRLIDTETGQREINYTGALADQFGCMAELGAGGCGFEQHLESMKRALSNSDENAGFLRDDAFLLVVFIQDEDDCSAADRSVFDPSQDDRDAPLGELSSFRCFEFGTTCEPADERTPGPRQNCHPGDDDTGYMADVGGYVDFLRRLKPDPSKVIVAAISGDAEPVAVAVDPVKDELQVTPACVVCPGGAASGCSLDPDDPGSAIVAAAPAVRMRAFLDGFPQRSTWQNICNYDPQIDDVNLSGALVQIASSLGPHFGSWCLQGELATPLECVVSEFVRDHERLLRPCDEGGDTPCYRLIEDPAQCPGTPSGLRVEVDRDGAPPPDATTISVRCLVET